MDNLRTSEIDRVLESDLSDGSDIETDALLDFSSGSEDNYIPNNDELDSSDQEDVSDDPPNLLRPSTSNDEPQTIPWVRVYPPEPEKDIGLDFRVRHPGPRDCPPRNSPPIVYALLFFTTNFWARIVEETNRYARKVTENKRRSGTMKQFSRIKKWVDVSVVEIKKFFAILINMPLNGDSSKPRRAFWDTRNSQHNSFFSQTMNVNRFEIILSNFHLTSKQNVRKGEPGYDPWIKVRYFLDHFNNIFKKYFHPWQNICIDESLIGMKNRCPFIMYMPNKKHKQYGIKKFECCDSLTNYVHHIEMYSSKDYLANTTDQPFTEKVIFEVLQKGNLLDKGHHLFTDNFYTKIPLAHKLVDRNTFLTGTINSRSKHLPEAVKKAKLGARESLYYRQGNLLIVNFRQKVTRKPVLVISTATHAEDILVKSKRTNISGMKPVVIDKYNQFMGGVDLSDKAVYRNSCNRHTTKYWKKIFFNMIDIALFNAYVLYKLNTDNPMQRRDFIISIVDSLAATVEEAPVPVPGPSGDVGHKLDKLPGKCEWTCVVCKPLKKRGRTRFWCPGCNCGVHRECYHQLQHFWRPKKGGKKRRAPSSGSSSD